MAKKNLLTIVQDILSAMNSDGVNSITDTREAMQVAQQCQRVFNNMVTSRVWPSTQELAMLDSSVDPTRPTMMKLKESVINIEEVRYDVRMAASDPPSYSRMRFVEYREFLETTMSRDPSASFVEVMMDYRGTPIFIRNDLAPSYFTCFDDTHLVFDSYNSTVDTTLQASKTQVYSSVQPEFLLANDFIPQIPAHLFSYYENECLAWCFVIVKEMANEKVESVVLEQKGWLSRNKHRVGGNTIYPNYGRRGRTTGGSWGGNNP